MAVEGISGANYNDVAKVMQRPRTEAVTQVPNVNMNITETSVKVASGNTNGSTTDKVQKDNLISEKQIKSAINMVNNKMHRTRCEFSYHEQTKRVSIKVMDKDTDEVIREIPPEKALEMVEKMWELAGLLVDEKR